MAAGLRLKQTYPVLQVEVFDAAASSNFRMSSNQLCMADRYLFVFRGRLK